MSERLRSIVEQLSIRPSERVLEIGCGHGVAATLVCQRLESGHLTAIDRSEKMIEAAKRRNAEQVEAGKAEFIVATPRGPRPGRPPLRQDLRHPGRPLPPRP
jgi:ubiquinone/menaquinone biosynthesis C-methylase UbiE